MNISKLFEKKKQIYSFELFPPKKTSSLEILKNSLDEISQLKPDYISVTYGAGGSVVDKSSLELASLIKTKYGIEPLAHLTCINSTKDEVKNALEEFKKYDIKNILALRGDKAIGCDVKEDFKYASDLIEFIKQNGEFSISAACYPEGHVESESLIKDIKMLKNKVSKGVTHLNSQLFFDNDEFFNFLELLDLAEINVPVQAGIMPITKKSQIEGILSLSGAKLPKKFSRMLARYESDEKSLMEVGIAYATEQIIELLACGVDGIHLYVMNNPYLARRITDNISQFLEK